MRRSLVASAVVLLALAALAQSPAKAAPGWSWPDGEERAWMGEWMGRGFRFSFVLTARRRGEQVDGVFVFTCRGGWPQRLGDSVREEVHGRWWQNTLTLDGVSVSDPTMWVIDRYRIDVGPRGELSGSSRTVNRDWSGHLSAPAPPRLPRR